MSKENREKGKALFVCLYGPANSGKSTLMYGLGWIMKVMRMSVELIPEYPKQLVHEGRYVTLDIAQDYIFAKHHKMWKMLKNKYRIVVAEATLVNSLLYLKEDEIGAEEFKAYVLKCNEGYHTLNFFIEPGDLPFDSAGRTQTSMEQIEAEGIEFKRKLNEYGIKYQILTSKSNFFEAILLLASVIKSVKEEVKKIENENV